MKYVLCLHTHNALMSIMVRPQILQFKAQLDIAFSSYSYPSGECACTPSNSTAIRSPLRHTLHTEIRDPCQYARIIETSGSGNMQIGSQEGPIRGRTYCLCYQSASCRCSHVTDKTETAGPVWVHRQPEASTCRGRWPQGSLANPLLEMTIITEIRRKHNGCEKPRNSY
jgi:hypothetical protein